MRKFNRSELILFERGYVLVNKDRLEISFRDIRVVNELLDSFKLEKITWKRRGFFSNHLIEVKLKNFDFVFWTRLMLFNDGYNLYYFFKREALIDYYGINVLNTSNLRFIWHTVDVPVNLKCRILTLRTCTVYHFKDKIRVRFNRVDCELALTYILKKFNNSSFSWCVVDRFVLITDEDSIELLQMGEIEIIKMIANLDNTHLVLEISSFDIDDHSEMYNILVFYENKYSFFDEVYLNALGLK